MLHAFRPKKIRFPSQNSISRIGGFILQRNWMPAPFFFPWNRVTAPRCRLSKLLTEPPNIVPFDSDFAAGLSKRCVYCLSNAHYWAFLLDTTFGMVLCMCAYFRFFAALWVDGGDFLVVEPATKGERLLGDIFDGFVWIEPGAIVWRLAEAFSFSIVTVVFNFLVADVPGKPIVDLRWFGGGTFLNSDEDPLSPGQAAVEDSRRMGFAVCGHISYRKKI